MENEIITIKFKKLNKAKVELFFLLLIYILLYFVLFIIQNKFDVLTLILVIIFYLINDIIYFLLIKLNNNRSVIIEKDRLINVKFKSINYPMKDIYFKIKNLNEVYIYYKNKLIINFEINETIDFDILDLKQLKNVIYLE